MDEQGLKVAEHQDDSLKNRRKLAEMTRGISFPARYVFVSFQFVSFRFRFRIRFRFRSRIDPTAAMAAILSNRLATTAHVNEFDSFWCKKSITITLFASAIAQGMHASAQSMKTSFYIHKSVA